MVEKIGPGALVLIVGPSGAGKDTLIGIVRDQSANDPFVVFPRRVVTRPASEHEDNDFMAEADFDQHAQSGAFALSWEAHGLRYGIPATINADIAKGRTVVCNVSRTVITAARTGYRKCRAVLITAPQEILLERVKGRSRPTDGEPEKRVTRRVDNQTDLAPDLTIENIGDPRAAAEHLHAFIKDQRGF
jgi:ribose 1,5-bisphosphokinase